MAEYFYVKKSGGKQFSKNIDELLYQNYNITFTPGVMLDTYLENPNWTIHTIMLNEFKKKEIELRKLSSNLFNRNKISRLRKDMILIATDAFGIFSLAEEESKEMFKNIIGTRRK